VLKRPIEWGDANDDNSARLIDDEPDLPFRLRNNSNLFFERVGSLLRRLCVMAAGSDSQSLSALIQHRDLSMVKDLCDEKHV
jgi:hypothetical protein